MIKNPVHNMNNPVADQQFWKARIDAAKQRGDPRYSVYVVREEYWDHINKLHKRIIEKEVGNKKALDAGCGYGRVSEWVPNYTGVDFSPDFIAEAKKRYPDGAFFTASLDALPFKDKEFDIVFMISVRGMLQGNLGNIVWKPMQKELERVAKHILVMEYIDPEEYELDGEVKTI